MVRKVASLLFALVPVAAVIAAPAHAAEGYELYAPHPEVALDGQVPHGIAVNQASQQIYVAITTTNGFSGAPGQVERYTKDFAPAGTFSAGVDPFYSGVAVNPVTQGFYAAQALLHTPQGDKGTARMDVFSSTGTAGTPFALSDTETLPQIATDSSGDVYYPNAATDSVQVFNSAGALQEEITCGGCPGGAFGRPVSVALNSEGDLYVADLTPDRVVKLTSSGGPYAYDSVLQSGRGAVAVAVDPGTDDVFVGDLPGGQNYHVVAYTSAGTQYDDFGAGLFTNPDPQFGGPVLGQQIAVDATSQRLYVGDLDIFYVFSRVTISPPAVTIKPASGVGQLTATMNATVNAKGHAVLGCDFEYTDEADFQANGFANATAVPCAKKPTGLKDTALSHTLTGLPPETSYRYRLTAASNAGSTTSGNQVFETLPEAPPAVTMESPQGVTQTAATLKAKVNPLGGAVSACRFEFGTSTSYGTDIPCSSLPGPVTSDVAQSKGVSGLTASTAYHYRLVVTSNAGTTEGEDVQFKTASPPPPPPPPPDPPPADPPESDGTTPPLVCGKGFRKVLVRGKPRCVKRCRRGFRPKRVRGKVRCVKRKRRGNRATRRLPSRVDRR